MARYYGSTTPGAEEEAQAGQLLPLPDQNGYVPTHVTVLRHDNDTSRAGYKTWQVPSVFDVVITPSMTLTEIEQAISMPTVQYVGFTPGDYRAFGPINVDRVMPDVAPLWLMPSDGLIAHPYDLQESARVRIRGFEFLTNNNNIIMYRLALDGQNLSKCVECKGIAQNILISDCTFTRANGCSVCFGGSNATLGVQYCVGDRTQWVATVDTDHVAIETASSNVSISSNEFWNSGGSDISLSADGHDNLRIENNDLYVTPSIYTGGNGSLNPNGAYAGGRSSIRLNSGGNSEATSASIIKNRFYGRRPADRLLAGTVALTGAHIEILSGSYALVAENIFDNCTMGVDMVAGSNLSINRNVIRHQTLSPNIMQGGIKIASDVNTSELYFNHAIFGGGSRAGTPYYRAGDNDLAGWLIIDNGASSGTWAGAGQEDWDAYVNSVAGPESNKQTFVTAAAAALVDYQYIRRLLSSTGEAVSMPNIRPTLNSTLENWASGGRARDGYGIGIGVGQALGIA